VHRMHVKMFEIAKEYLENHLNCAVIGGFISPSHDKYVSKKLNNTHITAEHRFAMCEQALENSDWISLSKWEALQNGFVQFSEVLKSVDQFLNSNVQQQILDNDIISKVMGSNLQIKTMFLMGADLLLRAPGSISRLSSNGIVCVGRPLYTNRVRDLVRDRKELGNQLFVVEGEEMDVSSTEIRKRLQQGKSIEDLTFPCVQQYLAQQKISGYCKV